MSLYCSFYIEKEVLTGVEFVAIIFSLFKLAWIIAISNDCTFEANQLPTIICRLLPDVRDKKIRKLLNAYGIQLLHDKLELTAGGFFAIDSKLVFSIIAAATTYTILVVQFLQYYKL
ncbi:hypothetical protein Zmor_004991 [Zophobas morio]|uniref:Gustatory receptor n=1 Tax=Zophobas morio TaxID=2755281 RepID=A0AA38MLY2_9CUCU|nr:hypothetical protein Zmor_004991 [Zophobas morio]